MKNIILQILHFLANYLNKLINYLNKQEKPLTKIISTQYDKLGNYFVFIIKNEHLLDNFEVLPHIFNTLKNSDKFINFGQYKVIIISAIINGQETSFHHNILINNNTTYQEYLFKVKDYINENYGEYGYNIDVIPLFKVIIFNMDKLRNKNIKITKSTINNKKFLGKRSYSTQSNNLVFDRNTIKPISKSNLNSICNNFITMDIETVKNLEDNQIPVCISTSNNNDNKLFINHLDVSKLWDEFFKYLIDNNHLTNNYIFVHNLGSFDGYFIYKALSEIYKPLGTWGDMTLNEAFNEIRELNSPVVKDAIDVVINSGGVIPAGMLYGGVVKLNMRNVNPHSEIMKIVDLHERMKALRIRRRELLLVMVGVAPISASIILFFGKLSVAELIHVSVQSSDVTSLSSEFFGLGFMSQFFLSKKPNWFKYLLIILTIIFVFKSNIYLYILPYLTIQSLKYFWMFSLFNTIIYFAFNYIFVKIFYLNKKNIKIPNNLPRFIRNQLEELKFISSSSLYIREKKRYKLFIIVSLILFIIAIPII